MSALRWLILLAVLLFQAGLMAWLLADQYQKNLEDRSKRQQVDTIYRAEASAFNPDTKRATTHETGNDPD